MIIPDLHRQPVSLDRQQHRETRLDLPVSDWSHTAGMNAVFVTAAECAQVASEYPIVFIKAGQDPEGKVDYAPIAVLGLTQGENLYLDGTRWRAGILPSQLALYPFCVARLDPERLAVCIDQAWSGVASSGEGRRLFNDDGEPTELTQRVKSDLERLEMQVDHTRTICRRLADLGLLREQRLDATMADGRKLGVDGFLVVDEDKVKALGDAEVLSLHRDGLLGMINAHWISLSHMRKLLNWRAERQPTVN